MDFNEFAAAVVKFMLDTGNFPIDCKDCPLKAACWEELKSNPDPYTCEDFIKKNFGLN